MGRELTVGFRAIGLGLFSFPVLGQLFSNQKDQAAGIGSDASDCDGSSRQQIPRRSRR
jgi:hypothetical protein